MGMANLIAEELDVGLDLAAKLVDEHIPIEAYDEHQEIPTDDVEGWLEHIWAQDYVRDEVGSYPEP
jgi:hypothetical protein